MKLPLGPKKLYLNGVVVGEYESTGDSEKDLHIARAVLAEKGLLNDNPPLALSIREQALSFAQTVAHLFNSTMSGPAPHPRFPLVPFVVNSTFAIELYLKALSHMHGKTPKRTHELVKLYDRLPQSAIEAIEACIPGCAADRSLDETPDVRAYLQELNNAFERWRYAFEYERPGDVRIQPTIFLQQVLHEACKVEPGVSASSADATLPD